MDTYTPNVQPASFVPAGPEEWLHDLLDSQLGSVIVFRPVEETAAKRMINEFVPVYCNERAAELAKWQHELVLLPQQNSSAGESAGAGLSFFQFLVQVWENGGKTQDRFYHPGTNRYFRMVCNKIKQGILVIAYDRTEEEQLQLEKEKQVGFVNSILDASVNGVFAMEAERNESGAIVDFRFVKINQQFAAMVGRSEEEIVGKSYHAV
ncbi:MAG TPA: PAS domain-containing protein, partial [Flavisolibacter sp.]|nr:PAS domain-containing protein [Flavisolibacter sp.]